MFNMVVFYHLNSLNPIKIRPDRDKNETRHVTKKSLYYKWYRLKKTIQPPFE